MKALIRLPYPTCGLRRLLMVVLSLACLSSRVHSQIYAMGQPSGTNGSTAAATNGSTVTTCGGTFLDPGGTGNYGNSLNTTVTFTSSGGGPITFDFGTTFNTQATNDYLEIFDGPTTSDRLLYRISGMHNGVSNKVGQLSSTGTSLTFRFVSNGSTNNTGWSASVVCEPPETYGDACVGGIASLFVFKEDFTPSPLPVYYNIGPALSPATLTGYTYKAIPDTNSVSYMINDGEYSVVKNAIYGGSKVTPRVWANFTDHTTGNGYMMLVNANYDPDTVYIKTVGGLSPNTLYFVSAYLHTASAGISITNCTASTPSFSNIKNANVDFKIYDAGNALVAINSTGNIQPADPDPENWRLYNTWYQTKPGETSIKFLITNRASGGCGNDFAIDDIEVRQCPSGAVHVLPAKLTNFNATSVRNKYVSVEWFTAEEKNSFSFTVQRSKDGVSWNDVETFKAGGNSTIMRSYNHSDFSPLDGVSYYRLKQTDMDGKVSYSDIRKVQIDAIRNTATLVTVGPNPFTDKMNVVVKLNTNRKVNIELLDITGKPVYTRNYDGVAGTNSFIMNNIPSSFTGMYTVVVKHGDTLERIKVMKQ